MPGQQDLDFVRKHLFEEMRPEDQEKVRDLENKMRSLAEQIQEFPIPKKRICILKGLPASGKTTLALKMVSEENFKRVNKDDLRAMLQGGEYSPESESFIQGVRDVITIFAVKRGFDVVIDDTNLNPIHQEQLRSLAKDLNADFEIVEVNTPLDECIRRDEKREKPVGEAVIRGMYEKYIAGKSA